MLLTKNTTFIIGPVAEILGYIMDAIFNFCSTLFNIENIGLCIILFTIVIYLLMLPLTIRQQKFAKLSAKMNPEIQAINKKYKDKKDQVSMTKMQEETKGVYAKYGVSPTGSCLQVIIQMPILFALYRVIWNVPAYVSGVKNAFIPLVEKLQNISGSQDFMDTVASSNNINYGKLGYTTDSIVDTLYKFKPENWTDLAEKFPDISSLVTKTQTQIDHMNNFMGLNIVNSPFSILQNSIKAISADGISGGAIWLIIAALMIPVLSGVTQWLNTKLTPQTNQSTDEGTMASSMKTMNTVMPLMSVVFCFTLPAGMGLYWIAGSVIRSIIQIATNSHLNKIDLDDLVKKNIEKENKKREKKGLPPQKISNQARTNVRNIESPSDKQNSEEKKKKIQNSTEYYNNHSNAKPGSLAAKARMVQKYNDKNKK